MWLFLSTWTYNFICTLTALAMVWVYEIAAPVSWALVAPALIFDNWRLAMPDDFAEDGPHHPIWHSPHTPLWIFGAFCFGILLVAPFLRFACFPTINGLVEPYFGVANRKLAEAGGVCGRRYGNFVYIYFSAFPLLSVFCVIYFSFLCKRSREHIGKFKHFAPSTNVTPKYFAVIIMFLFGILIHIGVSYIGLVHVGTKPFLPLDYIFPFSILLVFTFYPVFAIVSGCGFFCYAKLHLEKINDRTNRY